MKRISLARDRDRFIVSVVAALLLHLLLFVAVPRLAEPELDEVDLPVYVTLDPIAPPAPDIEPEPQEPEVTTPDPMEPAPQDDPTPDPIAETPVRDPDPPENAALGTAAEEPAPTPPPRVAQSPPPAPTPVRPPPVAEPPRQPAPVTPSPTIPDASQPDDDPPPEPPQVDAEPTTEAESEAPASQAELPEAEEAPFAPLEPVAAPPPQRRFTPESLSQSTETTSAAAASSAFVTSQLDAATEFRESYQEQVADWERRNTAAATQPPGSTAGDPRTALQAQLESLLDAIADAAENVVRVDDDGVVSTPDQAPDATGDGSGITVGSGTGSRARIDPGTPPNFATLQLPPGYPARFVVRLAIVVDANGVVVSATPFPSSGSRDLDERLIASVRTWRFERAPGAPTVRGEVLFDVETRSRL